MMSTQLSNPYSRGTPEHTLWAHWHRDFFNQPVHGQLLALESQLRHNLTKLLELSASLAPSVVQREIHSQLIELEESINLLDDAAEHAFVRVVSRGSTIPTNDQDS